VLALSILAWVALIKLRDLTTPTAIQSDATPLAWTQEQSHPGDSLRPVSAAVPPSWLPDPSRRHEVRWWDGTRWTEYVQDAGQPATDQPYV
jgi:hypothetical protein